MSTAQHHAAIDLPSQLGLHERRLRRIASEHAEAAGDAEVTKGEPRLPGALQVDAESGRLDVAAEPSEPAKARLASGENAGLESEVAAEVAQPSDSQPADPSTAVGAGCQGGSRRVDPVEFVESGVERERTERVRAALSCKE